MLLANQVMRNILMQPKGSFQRGLVAKYRFDDWRNLFKWSEDFSNAVWVKGANTTTTLGQVSPISDNSAIRIQNPANGLTFFYQSSTLTNGAEYILSFYVKAVSDTQQFGMYYSTTQSPETFTATGDWQQFSWKFTYSDATGPTNVGINNGNDSYANDIYVWGAHLQLASVINRSYQKTTDGQALWNHKKSVIYPANAISNGNFVDTAGWSGVYGTITAASNILTLTANGTQNYARAVQVTNTAWIENRKIYTRITTRARSADCTSIRTYLYGTSTVQSGSTVSNPAQDRWYTISGVVALTAQTGNIELRNYFYYADAAAANGKSVDIKEVLMIDLSALFGLGSEPTATQCDILFASWFDGIQAKELPKHNGTLGSTTAIDANDPAPDGQGLGLVTDEYIPVNTTGDSDFVFGSRPHSYVVAVKLKAYAAVPYNYLISTGNGANGEQSGIGVNSAGKFFVSAYSAPLVEFNTILSLNTPYILMAVYDGAYMNFYVNGAFRERLAVALNTTTGKIYIGAHAGAGSQPENAIFYTADVYKNNALTPGEIKQNYRAVKRELAEKGLQVA